MAWEARRSLALHSPANMSKRGLFARLYAPNQTLIRVKTRLPKGILDRGNGGPARVWQRQNPGFGPKTTNRPPAVSQAGGSCRQEVGGGSMIRKSGGRFCEKIMPNKKNPDRDGLNRSRPAPGLKAKRLAA